MAYRRDKDELRRDRALVAKMYLQGQSQYEIADVMDNRREYPYNRKKVQNDIKRVRENWEESAMMDFHQKVAEELARIDRLEQEYWEAWEASHEDEQTTTVKREPDEDGLNVQQIKQKNKENNTGDPQFLKGVQWCINKRTEILGLNAPEKTMALNIDFRDLTDEQLRQIEQGKDVREVISEDQKKLTG